MLRRYGPMVYLFILALLLAGCYTQPPLGKNYFYYKNGLKAPCNNGAFTLGGNCGDSYFYDENGKTYSCGGDSCSSDPVNCTPEYVYSNLTNKGISWKVVDHEVNQNNSASPLQVTFSSNTTATITVTDELGLTTSVKGSIGPIEASVETQINHSVTQSVTVAVGNQDTFTIPPGATAYANYGVKVQITSGDFYDQRACPGDERFYWGSDTTYVPVAAGWCIWTSDQHPCPSV